MKFNAIIFSALLTMTLAHAQDSKPIETNDQVEVKGEVQVTESKDTILEVKPEEAQRKPALVAKKASYVSLVSQHELPGLPQQEDQHSLTKDIKQEVGEEVLKPVVDFSQSHEDKQESLDEMEAKAHAIALDAKKKEQQAKKLQQKSEGLAKKSDKYEDKSKKLAEDSSKLSETSRQDKEESEKLVAQVESSEFKAQRDEVIKQMCLHKIEKSKFSKILDRRPHEQKLDECIADYKQSDLKEKTKMKKAYVGKECTFNPGISIECPEGTYKFISNDGLANVNAEERTEKKEFLEQAAEVAEQSAPVVSKK